MEADERYLNAWRKLYNHRSAEIFQLWLELDEARHFERYDLEKESISSSANLQRYFSRVAERRLRRSQLRSDLSMLAAKKDLLQSKYNGGRTKIQSVLNSIHRKEVAFYGNVKNSNSIFSLRHLANGVKKKDLLNIDYRDLVRYRIVCTNCSDIVYISIAFWENLFEKIAMCKNYYFSPLSKGVQRPYRGVHFLFVDGTGFPFELQIVSRYREAVGLLDHSIIYKPEKKIEMTQHISYLEAVSLYCNIIESKLLP